MTTTANKEFKGAAAATTTTNSINAIDTAVSIASATGWPTGAQPFTAVIDRGASNEEKVLCSARSGLGITISQRGYDNTATSSHAAGAKIEHCIAAADLVALFNHATNTAIDDHTQYLLKTLAASTYATPTSVATAVTAATPVVSSASVDASETTTSTAPTDLTTAGPGITVTVPASGKVLVSICADIIAAGAGYSAISVALSGANTKSAGLTSETMSLGGVAGLEGQFSRSILYTGLTPGSTTFTMKYWQAGGTSARFSFRNLIVQTVP